MYIRGPCDVRRHCWVAYSSGGRDLDARRELDRLGGAARGQPCRRLRLGLPVPGAVTGIFLGLRFCAKNRCPRLCFWALRLQFVGGFLAPRGRGGGARGTVAAAALGGAPGDTPGEPQQKRILRLFGTQGRPRGAQKSFLEGSGKRHGFWMAFWSENGRPGGAKSSKSYMFLYSLVIFSFF